MGRPKNLHLYDFGIFGCVPGSQNQLFFIFGDTRTLKTSQETTPWNKFQNMILQFVKLWKSTILICWKDQRHQMINIRSISVKKNWNVVRCNKIIWGIAEFSKPRNQKAINHNARNQTTQKLFYFQVGTLLRGWWCLNVFKVFECAFTFFKVQRSSLTKTRNDLGVSVFGEIKASAKQPRQHTEGF